MPTVYVDMSDFDSEDMIDELESRGYKVIGKHENKSDVYELHDIARYIDQKNYKEALIQLERLFPELRGISRAVS